MEELKLTREFTLLNRYGMHVRPAGLFAKTASRYDAEIEVEKDGNVVSGKSIMALMTLEAVCGSVLKVTAVGAGRRRPRRPGGARRAQVRHPRRAVTRRLWPTRRRC